MKQYEVATLKKGLLILDALQEKGMTLSEVIQTFSFNKSTAFRLLYTLEIMGYVKKIDNSYNLTNKLRPISTFYNSKANWLSVPPLHELSREVGETVYVGILYGTDVVTAQVVDGPHSMRAHTEVGDQAPVHLSALGKVILAFLDKTKLEGILKELTLVQSTKNTFADLHLLKEHLKVIRKQGYAVDDEETEIGLRCIAAPVIVEGNVISAVAISGPALRLNKKLDKTFSKKLIQCSSRISTML
ncbi:IclR family transcriptional regulator [Bacillus atrophaeus]|uniref:IclR family transcriptional regulator n=1 Tax=Bacillus atrophaeus TaxID=1452 RepID=UPI002E237662|nr:IclR family transcriptional regulator [Bacillus atrophaeus]MED1031423.1 IclR family transcriptional regulator [Bacillus atrophaeus]MED1120255.1 IclR family transcriptional regulator [Bacillus atrophaeus]MED1124611.1 IclR family transcriptional regulator [Bacillus atrophaeus]MED1133856.1 IclR family transcriptional regulator [Bacillus atrophaeus]